MDFIKVTAKTVEEAITEATIQLETSSDHIEYHVIEKGSSGFFGIGSKPAVIEARKKEESGVELEFQEIKNESVKVGETKAKKQQKPAKPLKPAKQNFKENEVSSEQPVKQQPNHHPLPSCSPKSLSPPFPQDPAEPEAKSSDIPQALPQAFLPSLHFVLSALQVFGQLSVPAFLHG